MEPTQPEVEVINKPSDRIEIHEPPTITNPWELMDEFYSSARYEHDYSEFYQEKTLDPSVTEKEKEKVFLENHESRKTFIDYATSDVDFRFNSTLYPPASSELLKEYVKVVKDSQRKLLEKTSPEEVIALDEVRRDYHLRAANTLVEDGIAPSINIGEALARAVLIDKGLDTPEAAKTSTKDKLKRKLS